MSLSVVVLSQHRLSIAYADKDSTFISPVALQKKFTTVLECRQYIRKIPSLFLGKGYPYVSLDSVKEDTAETKILLFIGARASYFDLNTDALETKALDAIGYISSGKRKKLYDHIEFAKLQQQLINYYSNAGYPFATSALTGIGWHNDTLKATLEVNKGVLYHVDSIRLYGKAKLSNYFLQRYLNVTNGSIYRKDVLEQVGKKISELPFVTEIQPADITMLGTGSVLNVYLNPKKSSQINFLVGFLPEGNNSGKLRLTGDVNLNLKNPFGNGETLLLNWQQLQASSPRLNLGYNHPYIFNSAFGLDFNFDLLKKDSSYILLNAQAGVQFEIAAKQTGKIYFQNQSSYISGNGIDTNQVKLKKQLPDVVDYSVNSAGFEYEWNGTDYKFNPRKGNELKLSGSIGIKSIKKSNDILSIKDPSFNYAGLYDSVKLKTYQLRIKMSGAHYFKLSKQTVLKTGLSGGWLTSSSLFRNELFQIGGYKLLRGFDEESLYASQYGVATAEYRLITGVNSYFFGFADVGWVGNNYQNINTNNRFLGIGAGLFLETKFGLLNIAYAFGKRNDISTSLSQASKIHFGYVNYF